jgi:predicted MFS family arabinose efflux permease
VNKPTKLPLFVFEALGSLACGFYGNYIFFLFRDRHGFGDLGNLGVAALMGFVIAVAAWQGGRFAQRQGCFRAMFLGLGGMMIALGLGALFPQLPVQLAVLVLWTASQFVVWPALESLVTEGVDRTGRARLVGIYSVVWATCSALSYFFGGALFERLGSGSIFWLPPGLHLVQVIILWNFARQHQSPVTVPVAVSFAAFDLPQQLRSGLNPQAFQRLAWLANPFACVAAFTLLAMIPELARKLGLSTTLAGLFCSVWFFARLASFILLWCWGGWPYRFRWLLAGYVLLLAGFFAVLTAQNLWWLSLGQVAFGFAVGLLYYSSLFYSMDVGEARAEHGGIHEAVMGAGNFVGPGIGAVSLLLFQGAEHAGVWAVGCLLGFGLVLLAGFRLRLGRQNEPRSTLP